MPATALTTASKLVPSERAHYEGKFGARPRSGASAQRGACVLICRCVHTCVRVCVCPRAGASVACAHAHADLTRCEKRPREDEREEQQAGWTGRNPIRQKELNDTLGVCCNKATKGSCATLTLTALSRQQSVQLDLSQNASDADNVFREPNHRALICAQPKQRHCLRRMRAWHAFISALRSVLGRQAEYAPPPARWDETNENDMSQAVSELIRLPYCERQYRTYPSDEITPVGMSWGLSWSNIICLIAGLMQRTKFA